MTKQRRFFVLRSPVATVVLGLTVMLAGLSGVWANGGGYHHGVKFSGTVAPFEPEGTENVQIIDEVLDIELGESSARVSVRYRMKNLADARSKVRFGFPVEAVPLAFVSDGEKPPTQEKLLGDYCHDYRVTVNGEALANEFMEEPFASGKVKAFPGSEVLGGIAGWMVSELAFGDSEELLMEISFRSDYEIKGVSVSSDSRSGAPQFCYRLSSGGVWAGPITGGLVRVHGSNEIDFAAVEIKSPANRFRRVGDAWVMEFSDLEPTLADDLTVIAGPRVSRYSDHESYKVGVRASKFVKRGERWQREHNDFSVSASSTLPEGGAINYGVENLVGWDWEDDFNVWCEGVGGYGIGEKLTLQVEKPLPLDAIQIRPGYGKTEALYFENSRPASFEVVLNGEHRFVASLEDEDRLQSIPVKGYDKPVETVELIIADVYPGSQHRDTCVAQLNLVARLAQEPKRYGAR